MKKFFAALFGLILLILAATFLLNASGVITKIPSFFWEILIFISFSTSLLFIYLYKAKSEHFIQLYLLTMVVKLIAYGVLAIVVILLDRENAIENMVLFLSFYSAFTCLELGFLYSRINSR